MKGRGFTETFPSNYVASVINRVIFGQWVLIHFIMQSLLEKRSTNLPCCPPKRGSRQSAILFLLSTAAAILTQANLMKSPFCPFSLL